MRTSFFLFVFLFSFSAYAQSMAVPVTSVSSSPLTAPVASQVRLVSDVSAITAGQSFWLAFNIKPMAGWHTYWQNPGDSGLPVTVEWMLPEGFKKGAERWPAPRRITYGGMVNFGYEGEAWLLLPVTAPGDISNIASFTARGNWIICKDVCIPESASLTVALPKAQGGERSPSPDSEAIAQITKALPRASDLGMRMKAEGSQLRLSFDAPQGITDKLKQAEFFPITPGIIENAAPQTLVPQKEGYHLLIKRVETTPLPDTLEGVLSVTSQDNAGRYNLQVVALGANALDSGDLNFGGWLLAIILAFLGGIILNLMPCVLPVLSLKALSLAKKARSVPREIRLSGIAYTAGVLSCFAIFGIILLLFKTAGMGAGWGFHLQSANFILFMLYLLFAIGLNLSGYFHLPVLLGSVGSRALAEDHYFSSFLAGLLAALIATPCTAPFMASAVGAAFAMPAWAGLFIFLSLGFGMALPYLAISFSPKLLAYIPKPGAWMEKLREFLAFPIYATAAWLLWIYAQQTGDMGVFYAALGCVIMALILWLVRGRSRNTITALLIAGTLALLILRPSPENIKMSEAKKMESEFSLAKLSALRAEGKPVLVDATAAWCITCQYNERTVLNSDAVKKVMQKQGVTLLVADWTNQNAEITQYLKSLGRRGVPVYAYYPPGGDAELLPQILTQSLVIKRLETGAR